MTVVIPVAGVTLQSIWYQKLFKCQPQQRNKSSVQGLIVPEQSFLQQITKIALKDQKQKLVID